MNPPPVDWWGCSCHGCAAWAELTTEEQSWDRFLDLYCWFSAAASWWGVVPRLETSPAGRRPQMSRQHQGRRPGKWTASNNDPTSVFTVGHFCTVVPNGSQRRVRTSDEFVRSAVRRLRVGLRAVSQTRGQSSSLQTFSLQYVLWGHQQCKH